MYLQTFCKFVISTEHEIWLAGHVILFAYLCSSPVIKSQGVP